MMEDFSISHQAEDGNSSSSGAGQAPYWTRDSLLNHTRPSGLTPFLTVRNTGSKELSDHLRLRSG